MTCFVKKLAPPEVGITAVFLPVISEAPNHGGGLKKRGGGSRLYSASTLFRAVKDKKECSYVCLPY